MCFNTEYIDKELVGMRKRYCFKCKKEVRIRKVGLDGHKYCIDCL